jgi:hypothetical protein
MDEMESEVTPFFLFIGEFSMVRQVSEEKYELSDAHYPTKGYIEVKKDGRVFKFKVIDDGGAGKKLTPERLKEIISDLIDTKKLALSSFARDRVITVEKEHCHIEGLHAPIVLRMSKASTLLRILTKLFKEKIIIPLFGRKSPLIRHITKEFRLVVEKLPENIQQSILKDLRITPAEYHSLESFGAIIKHFPDAKKVEFVKQVLQGAYVQIEDGGKIYDEWVANDDLHKKLRHSSHHSCDKQYSFQGPLFKECLFSKKIVTDENGIKRETTWFQLERYPTERIYALPHLLTWILYKITGHNQGPHGSSPHTEHNNPLILHLNT